MKKLTLWLLYFVLFVLFFVGFAPKKLLYYKLEHLLQPQQIVISDERLEETPISLLAKDGTLYIKSIEAGVFDTLSFYPDIFFNMIELKNFHSNRSITIIPKIDIQKLRLFYTPFYPIKIFIQGDSSLGKITGSIDLLAKKGVVDLSTTHPPQMLPLKKISEGLYRYEFSY